MVERTTRRYLLGEFNGNRKAGHMRKVVTAAITALLLVSTATACATPPQGTGDEFGRVAFDDALIAPTKVRFLTPHSNVTLRCHDGTYASEAYQGSGAPLARVERARYGARLW